MEAAEMNVISKVVYKLRARNKVLCESWMNVFKDHTTHVQVSQGDMFEGAPQADALVSPANSFGFMGGGIDLIYSNHFGWQMQERLQKVIREEYAGELLVGQAAIIPAFPEGTPEEDMCRTGCNEDKPIKYLISAPTMRVPLKISHTVNPYLAFRAVILAVKKHNNNPCNKESQIRSVLCPGLGTGSGGITSLVCAEQMFEAYSAVELQNKPELTEPADIETAALQHDNMTKF